MESVSASGYLNSMHMPRRVPVRYRNSGSTNSDSRQADRKILLHRWIRRPRGSKKRRPPPARTRDSSSSEKARDSTRSLSVGCRQAFSGHPPRKPRRHLLGS